LLAANRQTGADGRKSRERERDTDLKIKGKERQRERVIENDLERGQLRKVASPGGRERLPSRRAR
jgi:hypothetical protein